jgi:hypothetical protein
MRYAVYYVPRADEPLGDYGAAVLGYDLNSGADVAHAPALQGLAFDWRQSTETPRRYGFHATLRAPFHLAPGTDQARLLDVAAVAARALEPLTLGPLAVTAVDDFIALTPVQAPAALAEFERRLLEAFEPCRAAPTAGELARRNVGLSAREQELMARWGYPFVLDQFRFHMTLSGRLGGAELHEALAALGSCYPLAQVPIHLEHISVCRQPAPDARFEIVRRFALG